MNLPEPHSAGQRQAIEFNGNVALFAGRRYGKTQAYVNRILRAGHSDPGMYWWVGLSWKSASLKRAWRLLKYFCRQSWQPFDGAPRGVIREQDKEVHFPNGNQVWLRTADNEQSLAGEGIKGVVVDEFSLMKESVWHEYLEPSLIDYDGWAAFAGVPKGNNWATQLWRQAADLPGWLQLQFTTYDNPTLNKASIDEKKTTTPDRLFRQEYLAEIVAGEGLVFRNINNCIKAQPAKPEDHRGHYIVFGSDFAKQNDFSANAVGCADCKTELEIERYNQIDYIIQRERLKALVRKWGATHGFGESNSIGAVNLEILQASDVPIMGFETTGKSKPPLILNLVTVLENEEWQFLPDRVAKGELEAYEQKVSVTTGRSTYNAPPGLHDDTVIARALMLWAANNRTWLVSWDD